MLDSFFLGQVVPFDVEQLVFGDLFLGYKDLLRL